MLCHRYIIYVQATGVSLPWTEMLTGMLLAIMMVMGTIIVAGGSIVVYTFFAASLGLPAEGVAILISINWFARALQTIMNVTN